MAGLTSTSRSEASQQRGQCRGREHTPTRISRSGTNVDAEQGQEQRRLLMNLLQLLGAEDAPSNKLSNQDHGEGEGSEQRDQAELAFLTPKSTSRLAQASPSCNRSRRGANISSDEDDAEMCPGRMSAPLPHEHGRNESNISLPQQKLSSVQTRGRNWTNPEDKLLIQAHGAPYRRKKNSWTDIASNIPGRTRDQCRLRWDTLLRNYRKEHFDQGKSEEEYFQDLLFGRISCGQGEFSQKDHLQEVNQKCWKKRKTLESAVDQDCHCKRERLLEVHETTSFFQLAQRILKILERFLELKELKYERKASRAEQATPSHGDGLRAAEVDTTYWTSEQTNLVLPLHQDSVGPPFGTYPYMDCEGYELAQGIEAACRWLRIIRLFGPPHANILSPCVDQERRMGSLKLVGNSDGFFSIEAVSRVENVASSLWTSFLLVKWQLQEA